MSAFSVKGSLAALIAAAALAACGTTTPAGHPAVRHHDPVTTPAAAPHPTPSATQSASPMPTTPAATNPPAPVQTTPPPQTMNPIPQNNGGDHDADNNGGPSDGDGNI